jgi:hypothetical protein
MDWSEFSSRERAENYINQRISLIDNIRFIEYQDSSNVSILFEGIPVTAKRLNLRLAAPRSYLSDKNNLVIYYVVVQIDDKYLACILSHYTDNQNIEDLPLLLKEVMKLNLE